MWETGRLAGVSFRFLLRKRKRNETTRRETETKRLGVIRNGKETEMERKRNGNGIFAGIIEPSVVAVPLSMLSRPSLLLQRRSRFPFKDSD